MNPTAPIDITYRFRVVASAVFALPTTSCIVDAELIVGGRPDFIVQLHGRRVPVCVYCFDLLELRGSNVRLQQLEQRRAWLLKLLADSERDLRFSESFPDANALLAECARRGFEGIVCKQKDAPYRSGPLSGWIKVKLPASSLNRRSRTS
jgi:bifunctional non-homologous end joining protein LigD